MCVHVCVWLLSIITNNGAREKAQLAKDLRLKPENRSPESGSR